MVSPPEAEPVKADKNIRGDRQRDKRAAADRQDPVAHQRKGGKRGNNGAKADKAGDTENRQHGSVGAGVHARAQGRKTLRLIAISVRWRRRARRDRPDASDRRKRGRAPALFREERKIEPRQNEYRHQQIDPTTTQAEEWPCTIGGAVSLCLP